MKKYKLWSMLCISLISLLYMPTSSADTKETPQYPLFEREGHGGEKITGDFIIRARNVLERIKKIEPRGPMYFLKLSEVLSEGVGVFAVKVLIDPKTGKPVDENIYHEAYSVPGLIQIKKSLWEELLIKNHNIDYLIAHEIFRCVVDNTGGFNDIGYRITLIELNLDCSTSFTTCNPVPPCDDPVKNVEFDRRSEGVRGYGYVEDQRQAYLSQKKGRVASSILNRVGSNYYLVTAWKRFIEPPCGDDDPIVVVTTEIWAAEWTASSFHEAYRKVSVRDLRNQYFADYNKHFPGECPPPLCDEPRK